MPYGISTQKHHRYLPSPALDWFRLHFQPSGFNGRFQIGHRNPKSPSVLPLTTQPMDGLFGFIEAAHFSTRLDYYITANSFSGVRRLKEDLFSLHNIVIDIDLHSELGTVPDGESDNEKEQMFFNQGILQSFLLRLQHDAEDDFPSPTSVVWTGRGLQLWWAIVPMSKKCLTWYEEIRDTLILRLQNLAADYPTELEGLKVDGAASRNAVGYYRLPGTVNSRTQTLVTAEIWSGQQYDTHEMIKWAKQYKSELKEDESEIPVRTDKDDFSYSDAEVRILKNVFTLAFFRIRQMIRLRAIRDDKIGDETRNNMCLIVFNAVLLSGGEAKAWEKVQEFNAGFKVPMTEQELHRSLDTSVKKGGYRYKNETVISFLDITAAEQEQIGLYPGGSPFPRLSSHPSRTAARRLVKQHRNERIIELSASGKKNGEIARELGISPNTVTTVLGARRPRREEAREMKGNGMTESEIAEKLGVSVRTIERYLGAAAPVPETAMAESERADFTSKEESSNCPDNSVSAGTQGTLWLKRSHSPVFVRRKTVSGPESDKPMESQKDSSDNLTDSS